MHYYTLPKNPPFSWVIVQSVYRFGHDSNYLNIFSLPQIAIVLAAVALAVQAQYYHAPAAPAYHAPVYAAPAYHAPAEVYPDAHPKYEFSYDVADSHTGDYKVRLKISKLR